MKNLAFKKGFNIFVTWFERHSRPNTIEIDVFQDIYIMHDFICNPTKTVMSIYFAVTEDDGSIVRGINVPICVRYQDFYRYKEKLHLEYMKNAQERQLSMRACVDF